MAETINKGWLKDTSDIKFAPKTLVEQVQDSDGKLLSVYLDELNTVEVSSVQPTNETTQLWINPNVNETASLPEIKDDVINNDDTWSSSKIDSELYNLKADIIASTWALDPNSAKTLFAVANAWSSSKVNFPSEFTNEFGLLQTIWTYPGSIGKLESVRHQTLTWDGYIADRHYDNGWSNWKVKTTQEKQIKTVDVSATLKNLSWTKSNDGMCYAPLTSSTYGSKVVSATICGWGSLTPTYTVLPYITVPNKVSLMCPVNSFSQYASVTVRIVYVD